MGLSQDHAPPVRDGRGARSPRQQLADALNAAKPAKRSKYGAKPVMVDGVWFPSGREARRDGELQQLQRAGAISDLKRQVTFRLDVNGIKVTSYRADWTYVESGELVVEDAKGVQTDAFKIKRKLLFALTGHCVRLS